MKCSYQGLDFQNEAAIYVAHYNYRRRLAALGYTSPVEELDSVLAQVFMIIDSEIQKQDELAMKSKGKTPKP